MLIYLSNAVKYTSAGHTITVKQNYVAEKGVCIIRIHNPGEAIPEEKRRHLFERFYEGDYRRFNTIGTGIGLSLVKDLVLLHQGTIQVYSKEGEGNNFVVEIPVKKSAYNETAIDENACNIDYPLSGSSEFTAPELVSDTDDETAVPDDLPIVLLVEDNEELLASMSRFLKQKYSILTASNGREAINVLDEEEINLIVSDIMMPGMDGMELCNRVKNKFETSHIPFVLLTAKTNDEDRITGYEAGADGYITKPIRLPVLIAKIDNLLNRQKRLGIDFRKQLVFKAKELNYTSMDETFMQKAVDCVNVHLNDTAFDPAQFIIAMNMGRSTTANKIKQLTGLTISGFINHIRLQAACRLIDEKKKIRIADLADAVGFNDPKYFTACFRKKYGFSPTEYMERMNG